MWKVFEKLGKNKYQLANKQGAVCGFSQLVVVRIYNCSYGYYM